MISSENQLLEKLNTGGSLGCSDHALIEFVTSRNKDLAEKQRQDFDPQGNSGSRDEWPGKNTRVSSGSAEMRSKKPRN